MSGIRRNPEPVLVEAVSSFTRPVSGSWNQSQSVSVSVSSLDIYRLLYWFVLGLLYSSSEE